MEVDDGMRWDTPSPQQTYSVERKNDQCPKVASCRAQRLGKGGKEARKKDGEKINERSGTTYKSGKEIPCLQIYNTSGMWFRRICCHLGSSGGEWSAIQLWRLGKTMGT